MAKKLEIIIRNEKLEEFTVYLPSVPRVGEEIAYMNCLYKVVNVRYFGTESPREKNIVLVFVKTIKEA